MAKTKKDPIEQAMQEALESVERVENNDGERSDVADLAEEADDEGGEEWVAESPPPADGEREEEQEGGEAELSDEEKIKNLNDQLLRLAADFENFRKRARREQEELRKFGAEQVIKAMLPVLDNLERALAHADASDPILQGVQMVAKQFVDVIGTYGVRGFTSAGEQFDPERHEAMGQVPTDEVPGGAVFQEMEKGYTLHDRLLRPAKVLVAVPPVRPNGAENESGDG